MADNYTTKIDERLRAAFGEVVLRSWYRSLPPMTEEALERLCLRVEGCGMVGVDGQLIDRKAKQG
jgi:hypothetical protein